MDSWQVASTFSEPVINPPLSPALDNPAIQSETEAQPRVGRWELWARRAGLVLYILICLEVGMLLLVVPWTHVWSNNGFLLRHLVLRAWAMHGFVRGAISGLGLINLWLGIWEGVHYQERPRG